MPPRANNPSREISYYEYAAFLARQQDDQGTPRCAYCTRELTKDNHSLDHTQGGATHDADPARIVAACDECNHYAGNHSPRAHAQLAAHLQLLDVDPDEAARRVARILTLPLPPRDDRDVVRLAEEHFGERLQYERQLAAKRRGADPATAGTGTTRARRIDEGEPGDDETPF